MSWYRPILVWLEPDSGLDFIYFCKIVLFIGAILLCIYVVVPGLIIYGIYRFFKWLIPVIKKRKQKRKIGVALQCPHCHKKHALQMFKEELVAQTPIVHDIISRDGKKSTLKVTQYTYRQYEKCQYCGEIIFNDIITENKRNNLVSLH